MSIISLLTQAEVAEQLKVSPRTMEAWRVAGFGPRFVRVGRSVRYSQEEVTRWLSGQVACSTADPGESQR